jgi:hypothetical protein
LALHSTYGGCSGQRTGGCVLLGVPTARPLGCHQLQVHSPTPSRSLQPDAALTNATRRALAPAPPAPGRMINSRRVVRCPHRDCARRRRCHQLRLRPPRPCTLAAHLRRRRRRRCVALQLLHPTTPHRSHHQTLTLRLRRTQSRFDPAKPVIWASTSCPRAAPLSLRVHEHVE